MSGLNGAGTGTGARFYRHDGSNFVEIGLVVSIDPGHVESELIKTSRLNPTLPFHTYIPGPKNQGEVTVNLFFDSTGDFANEGRDHVLLREDVEGTTLQRYRIEFPEYGVAIDFESCVPTYFRPQALTHRTSRAIFRFQPSGRATWIDPSDI